jgi:hypothetical protein
MKADRFLELVKEKNHLPNFWMSREYIEKAGLVWSKGPNNLSGWRQDAGCVDEWFFPPLNSDLEFVLDVPIYAGFVLSFSNRSNSTFLDKQFIYDPMDFDPDKMVGKKWAVFRKNARKWPTRSSSPCAYCLWESLNPDFQKVCTEQLQTILESWSASKGHVIYDPETFAKFALFGENRAVLISDNQLKGLNVWDENFKYINFRICMDVGEPFLNEFLRYLFYNHPVIKLSNKLVNDGGCLDLQGLHRFKTKLNPTNVLLVYQYSLESCT